MATRRAYLFQKETGKEMKILPEDTVEADGIIDNQKEAKKVTFSSESEVFEFTRSIKIRKRNNVRQRSQVPAQELRRSKRNVAKGITVAESNEDESSTRREIAKTEKECSLPDVKVPRRSKRIGCSGITQDDSKVTELIDIEQFEDIPKGELQTEIDNQDGFKLENLRRRSTRLTANLLKSCVGETILPVKWSERLVDADNKGDELAKNNVKEVARKFQVGKYHRKDAQDDHKVEKVCRRSKRLVNDIDVNTNTQDRRRSPRSKANAANPSTLMFC